MQFSTAFLALASAMAASAAPVFTVNDFSAACIPHSSQCSYSFTVIQEHTMETKGVKCNKMLTSDGTLPAVTDGTCTDSSRTWTVTKSSDGGLVLEVSQPVSASSNQSGKNVDTSEQTIPIPSLDILIVWHSFMLNPRDYMHYANQVLLGRLGGKGIDWQQLKVRLDSIPDGVSDHLILLNNTSHMTEQQGLTHGCDFDMVAAIQRQLKFCSDMYDAKYLKSQYTNNILRNAIERYEKFFTLIAEHPGVGIAPTPDIDLVWHTHQLSPKSYAAYSRQRTNGRFVNHNDNLDDETLEVSGNNGEALFFARFGTPYRICLCEHCENRKDYEKCNNSGSDCNTACLECHIDNDMSSGDMRPRDSCFDSWSSSCMQCKNAFIDDCCLAKGVVPFMPFV
ncbi:hypothetical protein VMCG_06896 [Cytospora schulzeri]|uniref:Uncharacterized protein n=1 Tax=Cytospora schulzeri TaxID=448051 RepID=A0A423W1Y5_9PEZI|nr:hypothetical protein VMCG_06896 [Valsa malicola]